MRWAHRHEKNFGQDLEGQEIKELYEEWKRQGKPDGEGHRTEPDEAPSEEPSQFCPVNPPAAPVTHGPAIDPQDLGLLVGGGIIAATLIEDLLTGGLGIADDPATLALGWAVIQGTAH